ncbi:hypothetical protein JB92DRAFT_3102175 [Gautieria morchelliformis]|nr:hypothetical protein JB92DRAFT_3102175 [Gautieria morchelliformis]
MEAGKLVYDTEARLYETRLKGDQRNTCVTQQLEDRHSGSRGNMLKAGPSGADLPSKTGPPQKDLPGAYFHVNDELGLELAHENHEATVEPFRAAPFNVYVAEQALGDLVLVPPRSCLQVVHEGDITIKMSRSRMGLKSLDSSASTPATSYPPDSRLPLSSSCRDPSLPVQSMAVAPSPEAVRGVVEATLKSVLYLSSLTKHRITRNMIWSTYVHTRPFESR